MSDSIFDVAIVGGGVSGVYAAWRLATEKQKRVVVLEASHRIGGRLLSVTPPGAPGLARAELGGMRILPSVQKRIVNLLYELNKDAEQKIETYDFPVDAPANIAYLRGTHLRLVDFGTEPAKVPYRLRFQEHGKTAGAIVVNAIEQIVPGITNPDLSDEQRHEMARRATFDGKPLHEQGFWEVLARVMSGEAYQLALAAGGYQSTINNWNAADAIPWYLTDFGITPHYEGFKQGFQQVPLTLAERFKAAGGTIELGAQVKSFEVNDGSVRLECSDRPSITAKALILAMPRRSLELLAERSEFLQRESVDKLIRSVTPQPLFKLFTTYQYPWWRPAGVETGRTTTDLPVRQTYYWPTRDGKAALQGPAMLLASYDDGNNIGFWDSFRDKRGRGWQKLAKLVPEKKKFKGVRENAGRGDDMDPEWKAHAAPEGMVKEIERQLAVVHGLSYTPEVQEAAYMDWGDDPYGGGWNSWNVGVKSAEVRDRITQPVGDAPVYICGEAYSDAQGWVEGALQTADIVLGKFGIQPLPAAPEKAG